MEDADDKRGKTETEIYNESTKSGKRMEATKRKIKIDSNMQEQCE